MQGEELVKQWLPVLEWSSALSPPLSKIIPISEAFRNTRNIFPSILLKDFHLSFSRILRERCWAAVCAIRLFMIFPYFYSYFTFLNLDYGFPGNDCHANTEIASITQRVYILNVHYTQPSNPVWSCWLVCIIFYFSYLKGFMVFIPMFLPYGAATFFWDIFWYTFQI